MPISVNSKKEPLDSVLIEKIWIEIPFEKNTKSYLVSKEIAEYIEELELLSNSN